MACLQILTSQLFVVVYMARSKRLVSISDSLQFQIVHSDIVKQRFGMPSREVSGMSKVIMGFVDNALCKTVLVQRTLVSLIIQLHVRIVLAADDGVSNFLPCLWIPAFTFSIQTITVLEKYVINIKFHRPLHIV